MSNHEEITNKLIDTNVAMLDSFVILINKVESDLMAAANGSLQGETEELLREILTIASTAVHTILSMQEQLQTRFIESYFPAQD